MTKNERFKKALDWLYSEGMVVDQQELSSKTGINEATISRILNNKVRQPSPETIRKLVSTFRDIDPAYLRGESESVTVQQSPFAQQPQTPVGPATPTSAIDSSSAVNAALAAYAELTNRLKQEMSDRLSDKDAIIAEKQSRIESLERTIANLERTVSDKDAVIRARDARILELERRIAQLNADDLSNYNFPIGAADERTNP